jgi:WD40 repeat protein
MKPRSLLVATFLLGVGVLVHPLTDRPVQAQQPPAVPPGGPDRFGDLLPSAQALQRLGTVRFRHANRILALACSPDGMTLVAGGGDDTTRLWDADTG